MPTTCPEFEAAIKPYMYQSCGIAIIRPLGNQIVAYWGPRAVWGKSPLTLYTPDPDRAGVDVFAHYDGMSRTIDAGYDASQVQYVANSYMPAGTIAHMNSRVHKRRSMHNEPVIIRDPGHVQEVPWDETSHMPDETWTSVFPKDDDVD
jgi:hypothetical protein